jgi:hypothetical protein
MRALEVTGKVDTEGKLSLSTPLKVSQPGLVRVIILFPESTDKDDLKPAIDSFTQGWQEAQTGNTQPLSQLWEGIEDD